jgi:protein pelota
MMTVRVQKVDYDTEAPSLRVSGPNLVESDFMQLGQHHTMDLQMHQPFTLYKVKWDELYLEQLREATDPSVRCEIAALTMEEGLAHICLLSNVITSVKAKIEMPIPRKRKGVSGHDKSLEKFFDRVAAAVEQHINLEVIRCLIIASPGYTKDQFWKYVTTKGLEWARKVDVVLAHSSSGEKQTLAEIISDPAVRQKMSDLQFSQDLVVLDEFFRVLSEDDRRAVYSLVDVETAANQQAVQVLLISDSMLRNRRITDRQRVAEIIKTVKVNAGEVRKISSVHVAGARLEQLSGIAALLRFPIYDLQEDAELSDHSDEEPDEDQVVKDIDFS